LLHLQKMLQAGVSAARVKLSNGSRGGRNKGARLDAGLGLPNNDEVVNKVLHDLVGTSTLELGDAAPSQLKPREVQK
jgi:hypothetical protein